MKYKIVNNINISESVSFKVLGRVRLLSYIWQCKEKENFNIYTIPRNSLIVCPYHVTYAFQSESTLSSYPTKIRLGEDVLMASWTRYVNSYIIATFPYDKNWTVLHKENLLNFGYVLHHCNAKAFLYICIALLSLCT